MLVPLLQPATASATAARPAMVVRRYVLVSIGSPHVFGVVRVMLQLMPRPGHDHNGGTSAPRAARCEVSSEETRRVLPGERGDARVPTHVGLQRLLS